MVRRDKQGGDPPLDLTMARTKRGAMKGRAQKRRVPRDGWTMERRARFLEALSESCKIVSRGVV